MLVFPFSMGIMVEGSPPQLDANPSSPLQWRKAGRKMHRYIGEIVRKHRRETQLTQEEYGRRYGVSGPAIFKFEKGFVRPSLRLWMRISSDANISVSWAVRIWLKDLLPEQYKQYVELQGPYGPKQPRMKSVPVASRKDYSRCQNREEAMEMARKDPGLPAGLLECIEDDNIWALYKPSGREINQVLDVFSPLGSGSKDLYREALHCLRLFTQE